MLYDRKIKYLDYYENGQRVKGGGFLKLEVREGRLRMDLVVTGLHPTDVFEREVVICGEKKEKAMGQIAIHAGKGEFRHVCQNSENIGDTGIGYDEMRGIRIPLGAGREISCRWQGQREGREYEAAHLAKETSGSKITASERSENVESKRLAGRHMKEGGDSKAEKQAVEKQTLARTGGEEPHVEKWAMGNARNIVSMEIAGNMGGEEPRAEKWDMGSAGGRELRAERRDMGSAGDRELRAERRAMERMGGEEPRAEKWDTGSAGGRELRAERRAMERMGDEEPRAERRDMEEGESTAETGNHGAAAGRGAAGWLPTVNGEPNGKGERRERPGAAAREWEGGRTAKTGAKPEYGGKGRDLTASGREGNAVRLLEDKWQQLYAIYPHIRPFEDEREYVSIRPADFVLFPSESYKMANNSFLLHGYYNYKHLILTKVEKRGETLYYIGVPGTYYEKEKQVAIMFGFESFECAEEPAQAGDFGYYMMRTQL